MAFPPLVLYERLIYAESPDLGKLEPNSGDFVEKMRLFQV